MPRFFLRVEPEVDRRSDPFPTGRSGAGRGHSSLGLSARPSLLTLDVQRFFGETVREALIP
jgi:hypothetical protein